MSYWKDKVDPNAPKLTARLIQRLLAVVGEFKAAAYAEYFRRKCPACGRPKQQRAGKVFPYGVLCSACVRRVPKELRSRLQGDTNMLYPTLAETVLEAIKFIRANPQPQARRSGRKAVSA